VIYRVGAFELDEEAGELRHRGAPVEVQPKPLALLALLLRERHRVVSADELLERLWPDTAVTSGSLTRAVSLARRAIGDTHRGRVLRSFSRRGYRFCGEVIEVGAGPAPAERRSAIASGPVVPRRTGPGGADPAELFVGREEPLGVLRAALEETLAGRGGLAWVVGPPGIGKTRLAEGFAREAAARGPTVLFGRAREGGAVPAFWPWIQVLRGLLDDAVLGKVVRERTGAEGELGALLPELGGEESEAPAAASPEQRRFLLFDAVARVLVACSRERPLVVAVEDLQWAGEAALGCLEHLVLELRWAPVLLLATVREERRPASHPVERTLGLLRRQPHGREISLRGLSRREVAELLEAVLGSPPPPDLTSELYARTEGVPLFLREALRLLAERGELRHPERISRQGLVLPARAFDFVRGGLEGLDPDTRALVEAAAVLGREFPVALLAAVAGLERDAALDRLDAAERAGVVEAAPGTPATWRFVHALFREAALEALSTARRARLHQAAAEHLEARHRGDPEAAIDQIAHHRIEGLAVGDPERAFEVASRAAGRAERLGAWEQAAIHREQAAAALAQSPAVDPERRLRAWLALGEAHRLAGDRERRREVFGHALEAARSLDRPVDLARAAIGLCDIAEWSVRDPLAEAALREALDRLGDGAGSERTRLLARLAYQDVLQEAGRAVDLARQAVALAREAGDPEVLQEALYTLHFALGGPDALEERARLVGEMVEAARSGPVPDTTVIALVDVASDRLELGDAEGARRIRAEAERVAGPRPHPGMVWHLRVYDAGLALLEGRFEEARRLSEEASWLGRRIGHPYARPCHDAHRVGLARERGDHAEVVRLFERAVDAERGAIHYARAVVGRSLAALGRTGEARAHFERLAAQDFARIPRNLRWTNTLVEAAHLCAELADEERAALLAELLAPLEHHHGVLAVPVCYGGPLAFARARLLACLGQGAEARELLEEAADAAGALGARPTRARVALELGSLLARRGALPAARPWLEEALRLATELGLPEVEAAAGRQLGRGVPRAG